MIENEFKHMKFPVLIQKYDDGIYCAECTLFDGCFSQGKTMAQALANIREVIELCLEEEENQSRARKFQADDVTLHAVTL